MGWKYKSEQNVMLRKSVISISDRCVAVELFQYIRSRALTQNKDKYGHIWQVLEIAMTVTGVSDFNERKRGMPH